MPKKEKDTTGIIKVVSRLKEVLELTGYQSDVPGLSSALGYDRPDNIYNAISGEYMPGLKFLTDLSNKFENINIGYVLSGKGAPLINGDVVKIKPDKKEETVEVVRLRAAVNVLTSYMMESRSILHNRTLQSTIDEYEKDLTAQLSLLRTQSF